MEKQQSDSKIRLLLIKKYGFVPSSLNDPDIEKAEEILKTLDGLNTHSAKKILNTVTRLLDLTSIIM